MNLKDPTDNFNPAPVHKSAEEVQEEIARAGGSLRAGVGKRLYERIDLLERVIVEFAHCHEECPSYYNQPCTCGFRNLAVQIGVIF